ncbi:hypothetical protein [uncultured Hydrogenophaga sp.]|uniref:hypothetical protein n=1 Tax=uncultured Hydrogenophaga sp. TaxID=199683 RepID=UPI002586D034|nr:hypothetical protein [uncultured Hydrogenophaga sp.]
MSRLHLARLVQAYLQLPGAEPGGRSPDDAFTVLSPVDGHCVAIDWCPVDDTALICAHPFEGREPDREGGEADTGGDDGEAMDDLGRDDVGQWWLHEDLITGRTTLALRAPVAAWTLDDFSNAFETFCRRLAPMVSAPDTDAPDGAAAMDQPTLAEVAAPPMDLLLLQRA